MLPHHAKYRRGSSQGRMAALLLVAVFCVTASFHSIARWRPSSNVASYWEASFTSAVKKETKEKLENGHAVGSVRTPTKAVGDMKHENVTRGRTDSRNASIPEEGSSAAALNPTLLNKATTAAQTSFDNLELFVSTFPGNEKEHFVNGLLELKTTLIRSLEFFWPRDHPFRITVVLDDSVYDTVEQRDNMTFRVKQLFNDHYRPGVSVAYNPRSTPKRYGEGWFLQQLIMFWADNFTNSEYIGFVDDDTLFARAIQADELFDEYGRPRAIVHHASFTQKQWAKSNFDALGGKWPTLVSGMNYFPVIVHRKHLPEIRNAILEAHADKFSYFDEWYMHVVDTYRYFLSNENDPNHTISQFCIMLDYLFHTHRDDYVWHFEESAETWRQHFYASSQIVQQYSQQGIIIANDTTPAHNNVTNEMLLPFPRVAIHGAYPKYFPIDKVPPNGDRREFFKTKLGRPILVDEILRKGYCFSQPRHHVYGAVPDDRNKNATLLEATQRYCILLKRKYYKHIYKDIWTFGYRTSYWLETNVDQVRRAQGRSEERNPENHFWDPLELAKLFGDK